MASKKKAISKKKKPIKKSQEIRTRMDEEQKDAFLKHIHSLRKRPKSQRRESYIRFFEQQAKAAKSTKGMKPKTGYLGHRHPFVQRRAR